MEGLSPQLRHRQTTWDNRAHLRDEWAFHSVFRSYSAQLQQFRPLLDVPPTPTQFRGVLQNDLILPVKPRQQFTYRIQSNQTPPINSHKYLRVKRSRKRLQRPPQSVRLRATMQYQIVSIGLDPRYLTNRNKMRPLIFVHQQPVRKRTLALQLTQEILDACPKSFARLRVC